MRYSGVMAPPYVLPADRLPRWLIAGVAALAVAAIPLAAVLAQAPAQASFTLAETGEGFATLQAAVDAVGDGEGTIIIANGNWKQCAVQRAGTVTFRAAEAGRALLGGKACEGKAALVLRGRAARVDGLVFADLAVEDRNGAGIRLEQGPLTVTQSWFRDSEQGIMTTNGVDSEIRVDKSTFTRLGTCEGEGGCAHSIYVGDYGRAIITRSRFEQGTGGHYVKSRAAYTVVSDSSFDDSAGHGSNYMIDLPNGAKGEISGNLFVQGRDKENWTTFIAIGAEGATNSADGLVIRDNEARMVPGLTRAPAFIVDWTGDALAVSGNRLGPGVRAYQRR